MTMEGAEKALCEMREVGLHQEVFGDRIHEWASVLTEALAERERDAARYRWLRDHRDEEGFVDPEIHVAVDSHKFPNQWALVGEDLDAAIDLAMKETP